MKDVVLEPPVAFWNIDTQFGRAGKYVNHPTNLPTIIVHTCIDTQKTNTYAALS